MPSHSRSLTSGAGYFMQGFSLISQKGIRRFVYIPLAINIILFGLGFYYALNQINVYMALLESYLPSFLTWLTTLIWPLLAIAILVVFSFVFSTAANWIAAPFNGMLSEKVEQLLTGESLEDTTMVDLFKDIPRTLGREVQKLLYYLPRACVFLILFVLLPVVGQIIWFIFTAWMMAIQYKDYPFDNHKIPFKDMKVLIKQKQALSYSFGGTVMLFALIPVINLVVMPVAICGATKLWVDNYRDECIK